ncbi:MAG: hypothetical protein IH991_13165 [Planctomycetes bacterium]|nr:hypothetical protein [Planctomycetota bacterium]
MMAFLQDYRPIFMVVTFALLGSAFYLSYRPRHSTASGSEGDSAPSAKRSRRSKMMTFNRIMLWIVTVIVIVFLFFPQAVTRLFASGDELTADMQRTVISIEGMT